LLAPCDLRITIYDLRKKATAVAKLFSSIVNRQS
jgi:hypothetical protein